MNFFETSKGTTTLAAIALIFCQQTVQGYSPTTTDPVDYSQHGKNWNSYCIGRDLQSPINIESAKNYVSENAWFQLVNYQDMYDTKL